jgi:hypothetical protein
MEWRKKKEERRREGAKKSKDDKLRPVTGSLNTKPEG